MHAAIVDARQPAAQEGSQGLAVGVDLLQAIAAAAHSQVLARRQRVRASL